MSDPQLVVIHRELLPELLEALKICSNQNTNTFNNPIHCLYQKKQATINTVDPLTKQFGIYTEHNKKTIMVHFKDFRFGIQKAGGVSSTSNSNQSSDKRTSEQQSTSTNTSNQSSGKISTSIKSKSSSTQITESEQQGGYSNKRSKKNKVNIQETSDYFSASTSIEEGLCE